MRIDRDTARVVVPPVLALAFVAVLVHPMDEPLPTPTTSTVAVNR